MIINSIELKTVLIGKIKKFHFRRFKNQTIRYCNSVTRGSSLTYNNGITHINNANDLKRDWDVPLKSN